MHVGDIILRLAVVIAVLWRGRIFWFLRRLTTYILLAVHNSIWPIRIEAVLRYLDGVFSHPRRLLQGLAAANCILAGPRALDLFLPGSGRGWTWTFHTYHSKYCIGLAMEALSSSGVEWQDVFEPLREVAASASGSIFHVHIEHLLSLLARAEALGPLAAADLAADLTIDAEAGPVLRRIRQQLDRYPGRPRIYLANKVQLIILRSTASADASASDSPWMYAVTGYTTHQGIKEKVQITFQPDMTPVQHIFSYWTSSAQCCISAFGAFHVYYALAVLYEALCFTNNTQPQPQTVPAPTPPRRSWSLIRPGWVDSEVVRDTRLKNSWWSILVPFDIDAGLPHELDKARRHVFTNIKWEVSEGETRLTSSLPKSVRSVLEANRHTRAYRQRHDPRLIAAARLVEQHTVVFEGRTRALRALPDEMSGV